MGRLQHVSKGEIYFTEKKSYCRVGQVKSPKLSTVAANLLQYGSKRPLNTKIVKLDFGNQLGFDFEGRGYHKAIV